MRMKISKKLLCDIAKQINQQNKEKIIEEDNKSNLNQLNLWGRERKHRRRKKIINNEIENKENNEEINKELNASINNENIKTGIKSIYEDEHLKLLEEEKSSLSTRKDGCFKWS